MRNFILATLLASACAGACAQVVVSDAWVRATVAQQKVTGAFMQLTAAHDARLVEVRAQVAASAEMHTMSTDNNVMRMRQVSAVDLPAGVPVALKPGGFHIMLMGLHGRLAEGQHVPMTLTFESAHGRRFSIAVDAVVRPLAAGATGHPSPAH